MKNKKELAEKYNNLTISELRQIAKELGIEKPNILYKPKLIDEILKRKLSLNR